MPVVKKRLGASIVLTVLSLVSIILLLPRSRDGLQRIGLGSTIDGSLWIWGTEYEEGEEEGGDGIRLVIFGDSWVDDKVEKGLEGQGSSWGQVLCEEARGIAFELCCVFLLMFADQLHIASQFCSFATIQCLAEICSYRSDDL